VIRVQVWRGDDVLSTTHRDTQADAMAVVDATATQILNRRHGVGRFRIDAWRVDENDVALEMIWETPEPGFLIED
jgi:hypothetical protein